MVSPEMRHLFRLPRVLLMLMAAGGGLPWAQAAPLDEVAGEWRIIKAAPAPWATVSEIDEHAMRRRVGQGVVFKPARIQARAPLGCGRVKYESVRLPSRGLFQGGLPEPADVNAATLGLADNAVPTVRVSCHSGVFDYHFVDADTVLLGLDNVVWTLEFQPTSPRVAVQDFLRAHFAGEMAFTQVDTARKARWLTPAFAQAIDRYFDAPQPPDEPPLINGDPFTDSQEYPTGFEIRRVSTAGRRATVFVWYQDLKRGLTFQLQRSPETGWRIDDVRPPRDVSLRKLMASVSR